MAQTVGSIGMFVFIDAMSVLKQVVHGIQILTANLWDSSFHGIYFEVALCVDRVSHSQPSGVGNNACGGVEVLDGDADGFEERDVVCAHASLPLAGDNFAQLAHDAVGGSAVLLDGHQQIARFSHRGLPMVPYGQNTRPKEGIGDRETYSERRIIRPVNRNGKGCIRWSMV